MKTKETSNPLGKTWDEIEKTRGTREKALAWWKQLKSNIQLDYWRNYQKTTFTPSHSPDELTGREIEEIYVREVLVNQHNAKINQKQFKQFDESLFKSYIDKFSNEDKIRCFDYLTKIMLQSGFSKEQIKSSINFQ